MRTSKRPVFRPTLRIICGIGIVFCCLAWIEYRLAAQAQSAEAAEAALGLPFQGRLLTPSETPVTSGKWTALFSIYTTETGSNPEWSSGDMPLDVKAGGFFSTRLGAPASLPFVGIDFSQQLYVGVRIDNPGDGVTTANEPEMLPRIPLVPALYAHKAGFSSQAGDSALLAGHDWSAILVKGENDPTSAAIRGDKLAAGSVSGTKLSADVADGTTIELAEDYRLQVKDHGISLHKLAVRTVGPTPGIGGVAMSHPTTATFSTRSFEFTPMPIELTLETRGGPVWVGLQSVDSNISYLGVSTGGENAHMHVGISRDGTIVAAYEFSLQGASVGGGVPTSSVWYVDVPAAGLHKYEILVKTRDFVQITTCRLVAFEL